MSTMFADMEYGQWVGYVAYWAALKYNKVINTSGEGWQHLHELKYPPLRAVQQVFAPNTELVKQPIGCAVAELLKCR